MAATPQPQEVTRPENVDPVWLAKHLHLHEEPKDVSFVRVGTGQMSECYRFTYNNKSSVILKVAAQNGESRHTGASLGLYQREVLFYQHIASLLPGLVSQSHYAAFHEETESFAILLDDNPGKTVGDDIAGASVEQAKACLSSLARIHSVTIAEGDQRVAWLKREPILTQAVFQLQFERLVVRYRDLLSAEELNIIAQLVKHYDSYKVQQRQICTLGMIHGDFRLDNILLGQDPKELTIVDWQTVSWGPIAGDLAYFLGGAMHTSLRREHFEELVSTYYEVLGSGAPFTLEKCYEDLRHEAFYGLIMLTFAAMAVEETERGNRMFVTMLKRHCDLVLQLDSMATLPSSAVIVPIVQPTPRDEKLHPRTTQYFHNESYYFDFGDPQQQVFGYIRLGITPNVPSGGWYLAVICRPGKPVVTVMDYASPIAGDDLTISTGMYKATHRPTDPLTLFEVTLRGDAEVYSDASDIFPGRAPQSITPVSLDLKFHTDGIPYQYRITTRYEIPCLVDGSIIVGDEKYTIKQQIGQRDHSWGVRNWWNMDWLWSAIHFPSGIHVHAIDLYVQGQGQLGVGYFQKRNENEHQAVELDHIDTKWDRDEKTDLIRGCKMSFTPQGQDQMTIDVQSISHGPLRLVSEDGKVAFFDRAWCKCTLSDGQQGYGWVEWNRVQP